MRRKTYRATIINSGHTSVMLVGGYNKPSVKKQLTDFFIKTNQIKDYTKFERFLYTFLILLAVFIFGVQIGIAHGKELQRQEHYEYITTN